MCGRFASLLPPEAIARIFGTVNPLPNFAASWNLCPRQDAPVIRRNPQTGARHLDLLRWGLLPHFTQDPAKAPRPINARSETIRTSGMFRAAFAARRCIIPASAFYEWREEGGAKQPYAIARVAKGGADRGVIAFAGLWESWRAPDGGIERSFTIATTTANNTLRELHERMPVILDQPDWPLWLGEAEGDPAALLRPLPDDALEFWKVSRAVSSPRNNGPELLEPVAA